MAWDSVQGGFKCAHCGYYRHDGTPLSCEGCKRLYAIPDEPTLRDQFAMAALTGLCATAQWRFATVNACAKEAYDAADAMLAARSPDAKDTD